SAKSIDLCFVHRSMITRTKSGYVQRLQPLPYRCDEVIVVEQPIKMLVIVWCLSLCRIFDDDYSPIGIVKRYRIVMVGKHQPPAAVLLYALKSILRVDEAMFLGDYRLHPLSTLVSSLASALAHLIDDGQQLFRQPSGEATV